MASSESTTERGQRAESLACRFLAQNGYRLLEQNFRCRGGEIDIIAEEGEVLCFVEVRSRRSVAFGDPLETVDHRKQQRLIRAARRYLALHHDQSQRPCRFDVIGIVYHEAEPRVRLVRGAFEEGSVW